MASLVSVRNTEYVSAHFMTYKQIPPLTPTDSRVKFLVPLMPVPQNVQSSQMPEDIQPKTVGEELEDNTATSSPIKSPAKGWIPVRGSAPTSDSLPQGLDLS